ncbi:MAG: sensor histidine kinase [Clostridiales bacterium]|nr:sensor histidine kinase [Clostridiales bacterium]
MNKRVFLAYIRSRFGVIVSGIACVLVVLLICWIYGFSLMPAVLSAATLLLLGAMIGMVGYRKYAKKHDSLEKGKAFPQAVAEEFSASEEVPESVEEKVDLIEQDYRDLLVNLSDELSRVKEENASSYNAMLDYYTMWVHQIKTPIAALSLIIQNMEDQKTASRLRSQLIHVENYADMALNYLRLGSESNDLQFTGVNVDEVVRAEIRRAMTMFTTKGLSVDFTPSDLEVKTDKKWLGFIISQLLSNAIKYQKTGTIHFYGDKDSTSFTIEDEGIGIAKEDLPRIFEKGYTGYNGHNEKKSTGLGLYLVKKAADLISAQVLFDSEVGKGTKVTIRFGNK